ncbi:MAG: NAD(P)H-hydrate epimerase, partial [Dehalococcoidia bacterium]
AAEPDQYSGVPGLQTQIITNLGMTPRIYQGEPLADSDIVLDALIGYGLEGAVLGMSAGIIHAANSADRPVISLDLPSGLDADSGDAPGEAIRASATLTLALPKTGFLNPASQKWTGKLFLADISVPQATYRQLDSENVTIFGRGPLVRLTQNFKGTQA